MHLCLPIEFYQGDKIVHFKAPQVRAEALGLSVSKRSGRVDSPSVEAAHVPDAGW